MKEKNTKPVIFLAFANDQEQGQRYLRKLRNEAEQLRKILEQAEKVCELVVRQNASLDNILDVFQNPKYKHRIAIFHFGGHANSYKLLLESPAGKAVAADASGLAAFLAQQHGLHLVYLNGCSTQQQVQGLLEAGIKSVVATDRKIDDGTAVNFAARFYQGLTGGDDIRTAFEVGQGAIQAAIGDNKRDAYFEDKELNDVQLQKWPWDLYPTAMTDQIAQWSLREAAGDPLFGLPPLSKHPLPSPKDGPFLGLSYFREKHAELFFGRGTQIRELYDLVTNEQFDLDPLILLYGQSGVGKSSLLAAGLLPRLKQVRDVRYIRREDAKNNLSAALQQAIETRETDIAKAWHSYENAHRPLIIIFDQVEEIYTRAGPDPEGELAEFLNALENIFGDNFEAWPKGKLILSFRKEWLAEIRKRISERDIPPPNEMFLESLDSQGVMEAITGPTHARRLQARYRLTVSDDLPTSIANDLLADRGSAIAPTLQIILTKLWEKAKGPRKTFDRQLYDDLRLGAQNVLDELLSQQLAEIAEAHPETSKSGLVLDLLAYHTTELGTARQRSRTDLQQSYGHQVKTLATLVQACKDRYLLVDPASDDEETANATRLTHDTLAPLVRRRFDESDAPGQRARRILESRVIDWRDGRQGTPLDELDLITVERGAFGMRVWTPDEDRIIVASRQANADSLLWRVTKAAIDWYRVSRKEARLWHQNLDLIRLEWLLKVDNNPSLPTEAEFAPHAWLIQTLESGNHRFNTLEIEFIQRTVNFRRQNTPELTKKNNPYLGLQPYDEADRNYFFGRQKVVAELYERVRDEPVTYIIGPWGGGKSSLIEAGLIPQLQTSPSDVSWHILPSIRPGIPLLTTLAEFFEPTDLSWSELHRALDQWLDQHLNAKLVLIVDQLEEFEDHNHFLPKLADTVEAYAGRVRLVLALRAEFEGQIPCEEIFGERWPAARFELAAFTPGELREVVVGPAFRQVVDFNPDGLVERLTSEAQHIPHSLPLLSLTLHQLYSSWLEQKPAHRSIIESSLQIVGGLTKVLESHATMIYENLNSGEQAAMERIFLRLIERQEQEFVSQPLPVTELDELDPAEQEQWQRLIPNITEARLIARRNGHLALAYDSLLSWPKVSEWFAAEQARQKQLRVERFKEQVGALLRNFRRSIAVIIGINEYGDGIPALSTPVNDALHLAQIMKKLHNHEVWLLLDQEATLANLRATFKQLKAEIGPEDRIFFYYGGHGLAVRSDDGPVGLIVPQDSEPSEVSSMLSMPELNESLNELNCKHLLAILDCDFAGAFRWSTYRPLFLDEVEDIKEKKEAFERYLRSPAWQVITSTGYDQEGLHYVAELGDQAERHSPFAWLLFKALNGAADLSGDGVITATELYIYLRDQVEAATELDEGGLGSQTPALWPMKKHDKGEYMFLVPRNVDMSLLRQVAPVERSGRMGALRETFDRNLAVVIGINEYGRGISPLQTPVNDAEHLADLLHGGHGYDVWLLNQEVTLTQLRTLLNEILPMEVRARDRLLFYFAGHGVVKPGDGSAYLVPQDADIARRDTFLPALELFDALTALPCQQVLTILDCCFAGGLDKIADPAETSVRTGLTSLTELIQKPAWQVITSTTPNQKAFDGSSDWLLSSRPDTRHDHSPFASALFHVMLREQNRRHSR